MTNRKLKKIVEVYLLLGVIGVAISFIIPKDEAYKIYGLLIFIEFIYLFKYCLNKNGGRTSAIIYTSVLVTSMALATIYFNNDLKNKILIAYCLLLNLELIICNLLEMFNENKNKNIISNEEELFRERKADLEEISKKLHYCNVITINGDWGSGKTFLMEKIRIELKDKYFFIDIKTLTYNIDNLEAYIIDEVDSLLNENGIMTTNSLAIKKLLNSNTQVGILTRILFSNKITQTKALEDFINSIGKLDKPVVLIFEDIDRLNDWKSINKIFSIADSFLYNNNIKIVYECYVPNISILSKQESTLKEDYIEKYFSNQVNLTEIGFYEIIRNLLNINKIKYNNLSLKDFNFISNRIYQLSANKTYRLINLAFINDIGINKIRKIKNFLTETNLILENKEINKEDRKIVIVFYFVKCFFPEILDNIYCEYYNLIQIFPIKISNDLKNIKTLSEKDLLDELDKDKNEYFSEKLFGTEENTVSMWLLSAIGYNFYAKIDVHNNEDAKHLNRNAFNESIKNQKNVYCNQRIFTIFMNLYQSGKIVRTDEEQAVINFKNDVLSFSEKEWKLKFEIYLKKYYDGEYELISGNKTIFYIGYSNSYLLFRAMGLAIDYILNHKSINIWEKFLKFYFEYYDKETNIFNLNVVANLLFCPIERSKKLYIYIIDKISNMKTVGYLDDNKAYREFVYRFLVAINQYGYIKYDVSRNLRDLCLDNENNKENLSLIISDSINQIKQEINDKYKNETIKEIAYDIKIIDSFLDKILEIEKHDTPALVNEFNVNVSSQFTFKDKTTYDDILEYLKDNNEDIDKILFEKYKSGELTPVEIVEIRNKILSLRN